MIYGSVVAIKKTEVLVEVLDLKKYFLIRGGILSRQVAAIHAVDGVSFDIREGETFGLVGESGCGKTTVGRLLLNIIKPTAGTIRYRGRDISNLSRYELRKLRRKLATIFQDPYSSLDPRMTVRDVIREPLDIQESGKEVEKNEAVAKMLDEVELDRSYLYKYPHELSGGEKQRVAIARALIINPEFLVADEPVSSIDVSLRAQILNLIKDLLRELRLTCMFISHDLSVVEYMSDRVAVMYLGKLVELARLGEIYDNPQHPYTEALLSAIPVPGRRAEKRIILRGVVPTPINPPSGCRFHTRCPYSKPKCAEEEPKFIEVKKGHFVACHLRQ